MPLNVLLTVVSSTPLHRSAIVYRAQDDALCQHIKLSVRASSRSDRLYSILTLIELHSYSTIPIYPPSRPRDIFENQVHLRSVVADVVLLEMPKKKNHFCSPFISSRSSVKWATLFVTAEFVGIAQCLYWLHSCCSILTILLVLFVR